MATILGAHGLSAGRDLYRARPDGTQDLDFGVYLVASYDQEGVPRY
jgi:hypothetical protein